MSEINNVLQTGSQLTTNYNRSKIFLGANRFKTGSIINTGSEAVTLKAGTLLARVKANAVDTENVVGYLRVFDSENTEGGNTPVGILANEVTIEAGETVEVTFGFAGDFDKDALELDNDDDTLDTVVENAVSVTVGEETVSVTTWSKKLEDLIVSETQLIGVDVDQLSAYDNQ